MWHCTFNRELNGSESEYSELEKRVHILESGHEGLMSDQTKTSGILQQLDQDLHSSVAELDHQQQLIDSLNATQVDIKLFVDMVRVQFDIMNKQGTLLVLFVVKHGRYVHQRVTKISTDNPTTRK